MPINLSEAMAESMNESPTGTSTGTSTELTTTEQPSQSVPDNSQALTISTNQLKDLIVAIRAEPEKPHDRPTLWQDPKFQEQMNIIMAFSEGAVWKRDPEGKTPLFINATFANMMDNIMLEKHPEWPHINSLFLNIRKDLPDLFKKWDPKSDDPMPNCITNVDWFKHYFAVEMKFKGFVAVFANTVKLEEDYIEKVLYYKKMMPSEDPLTELPDAVPQAATLEQQLIDDGFTPTSLGADSQSLHDVMFK